MKLKGKFIVKVKPFGNLKELFLSLVGKTISDKTKKYYNKKLKKYDIEVVELRTDGVIFRDLRTGWKFIYLGD